MDEVRMRRPSSLIAFLAVGLCVAWLTRNQGWGGGIAFIVAFIPALLAGWIVDKLTSPAAKQPPSPPPPPPPPPPAPRP